MPDFGEFKALHLACVLVSTAGFVARGIWMMTESPCLNSLPARILPHVVDTLLLASGVGLVVITAQYPLVVPWLTAKLAGLLAYIVLGAIALRYGPSRRWRIGALASALVVLAWMVSVAVTRDPWGVFGLFA